MLTTGSLAAVKGNYVGATALFTGAQMVSSEAIDDIRVSDFALCKSMLDDQEFKKQSSVSLKGSRKHKDTRTLKRGKKGNGDGALKRGKKGGSSNGNDDDNDGDHDEAKKPLLQKKRNPSPSPFFLSFFSFPSFKMDS